VDDVANGYFVDQKYIDFVFLYFKRVFIEKNVGYNVAYWNAHSRRISRKNGRWLCNSQPLYFFHFSGYSAQEPGRITAHVSPDRSRYTFSTRPDLQQIFSHYEDLLTRNGYQRARSWPYTFASFNTGERIPHEVREFYRNNSPTWARWGDPFASSELKSGFPITMEPVAEPTAQDQLDAILSTRAWRWVSRYGRFKHRYLLPAAYKILGKVPETDVMKASETVEPSP
jgi:hypothetical protein